MAARSTKINFANSLSNTYKRSSYHLQHGKWTTEPYKEFTTATSWESESDGFMTGTEGDVTFSMVPNIAADDLYFHWNNPWNGSNSYDSSCDPNYHVESFSASGDNATVNCDLGINPNNVTLPLYNKDNSSTIKILDVWGEGRIITQDGLITGFSNAYNLNLKGKLISNGPNKEKPIPNLIEVLDYDNPTFPIGDNKVNFITLMGAPMVTNVAKEICRVFNKNLYKNEYGLIILYGLGADAIKTFTNVMPSKMVKVAQKLYPPFDVPNLTKDITMFRMTENDDF